MRVPANIEPAWKRMGMGIKHKPGGGCQSEYDPNYVCPPWHLYDEYGTLAEEPIDRLGRFKAPIAQLMNQMGLSTDDPEFAQTPRRVAEWFMSFARKPNYEEEMEDFLSVTFPSPHEELIWESGLSYVSLCPHHFLPYSGTASIGYIPGGRVVGISKLARALEYWTHYPVKQEDATANLADAIMKYLTPLGVMIVMRAFHTCMGLRGVKQPGHQTGTSAVRGIFATDDSLKTEFMRFIGDV